MREGLIRSGFWQVGTVMDVTAYPLAAEKEASSVRYDVTLRVGNTEYVVEYVSQNGTFKESADHQLGLEGLVLVGAQTMEYNDILGNTREVPIIRRRTLEANSLEN